MNLIAVGLLVVVSVQAAMCAYPFETEIINPDEFVENDEVVLNSDCNPKPSPCNTCGHVPVSRPCGCSVKPKPIVLTGRPRNVVVNEDAPFVFKTPSVLIRRPGGVRFQPRIVKFQPSPLVLRQKIVKLVRPVHKKVFVEQFTKKEFPCAEQIIDKKFINPCPEHKEVKPCSHSIPEEVSVDNFSNFVFSDQM